MIYRKLNRKLVANDSDYASFNGTRQRQNEKRDFFREQSSGGTTYNRALGRERVWCALVCHMAMCLFSVYWASFWSKTVTGVYMFFFQKAGRKLALVLVRFGAGSWSFRRESDQQVSNKMQMIASLQTYMTHTRPDND